MEMSNDRKEQKPPPSSPFPWWWDGHNRPPQSQWLHSTLAELDEKIKTILDLIEDNGDTFAKRAEMYYQKRPQLIKMVQDLHRSYRALADKYDQLQIKSEPSIKPSTASLSNSFRKECEEGETHQNNEEFIQEFSAADTSSSESSPEFQSPNSSDKSTNNMEDHSEYYKEKNKDDLMMREKVWINKQMKFSELLEENLSKQAELIRRNDEKREVINELRNEKMILSQNDKIKEKHKGKRRLKGLFCFSLNNSC